MPESPLDAFLLVGFPYLALIVLVVGSIYRYRQIRFSYSALSSQFLENKRLLWGTVPFHLGIIVVLLGHLVPLVIPGLWQAWTSNPQFLVFIETVGVACAVLALVGLLLLLARRVTSARLQAVTTTMDVVVIVLLLVQIGLGLGVALLHRWGAQWSAGTMTPYLRSIVLLRPEPDLMASMPPLMKFHLAGAWLLLLLVPFTRLVHLFTIPLGYLTRPPQRVIWTSTRRLESTVETRVVEARRRSFLLGLGGIAAAGVLLSAGVLEKVTRYFRGPDMTRDEEATLLRKRLKRLEMTAQERELELERMRQPFIRVGRLGELSPLQGRYFIDYQMRPALAFRDQSGLPLLISAKCTHLGCTVSSEVDQQGRLLCPCHVSYFDVRSGQPNAGSPAKAPLPLLGWVVRDAAGQVVASRAPGGALQGALPPQGADVLEVFIAREFAEAES